MAVVGMLTTGSLAALPAGLALSHLAWSDLTTRRFSLRLLAGATLAVSVVIAAEATRRGTIRHVLGALAVLAVVLVSVGLGWLATRGVSFGDVLLVGFAALVPAWMSPAAVLLMVGSAFVAAGAVVVARRLRYGQPAHGAAVALGPALLVGWLVGVSFG